MSKLDKINELLSSAEQILENMKAIRDKQEEPRLYDGMTKVQWKTAIDEHILESMKAIRDESEAPKLFDGLTEEQWQTVIDEKLICNFWDSEECKILSSLWEVTFDASFPFFDTMNDNWIHCKLHPSQPQFCNGTRPEGLDDEDVVIVFYTSGGYSTGSVDTVIDWAAIKRWQRVKV